MNNSKTASVVAITTDFITLQQFLKFAGVCGTGGGAKDLIQSGGVKVNGEVCVTRGRKLRQGDTVSLKREQSADEYVVG